MGQLNARQMRHSSGVPFILSAYNATEEEGTRRARLLLIVDKGSARMISDVSAKAVRYMRASFNSIP